DQLVISERDFVLEDEVPPAEDAAGDVGGRDRDPEVGHRAVRVVRRHVGRGRVVAHRGRAGDAVARPGVGQLRAALDHGRLRAVVALRGVVRVLRLVVRVLGAVVGLGVVDLVGVLGAVGRILFGGVVLLGGVVRGALLLGDGGAVPLNRFVGGGLLAATA